MKLHTNLTSDDIVGALHAAQKAGKISLDVYLWQFVPENSKSHPYGYLVQLGSNEQRLPDGKSRHYKNSGKYGADRIWAATYDEWGWFINEIFDRDPGAVFGHYRSADDFHVKTDYKFA